MVSLTFSHPPEEKNNKKNKPALVKKTHGGEHYDAMARKRSTGGGHASRDLSTRMSRGGPGAEYRDAMAIDVD